MNDHRHCDAIKEAVGPLPDFAVPKVIVFFGLEWPVKHAHRIVEIDTMLGDVAPVLGLVPFKLQSFALPL